MRGTKRPSPTEASPLYITVGPPACGKTTWLKQKTQEQNGLDVPVMDIALDDHPGIYIPVDSRHYLGKLDNDGDDAPTDSARLQEIWFESSLQTRIDRDRELQIVCKRCAGLIAAPEMKSQMAVLLQATNSSHLLDPIVSSYESVFEACGDALKLPQTTDLYVFESIFKPNPVSPQSALQATKSAMFNTKRTQPMAWGNTNTKSSDYQTALQVAARQRRPVHFVLYDARRNDNKPYSFDSELPGVGYEGLLQRNLRRFLQTGRYVPAKVISDMEQRTCSLYDRVEQQWARSSGNNTPMSTLDRDKILAGLAGFDMTESQQVIQRHDQQQQQHHQYRNQDRRNNNNNNPRGSRWDNHNNNPRGGRWDNHNNNNNPRGTRWGPKANPTRRQDDGGGEWQDVPQRHGQR